MRLILLPFVLIAVPTLLTSQESQPAPKTPAAPRTVTATGGVGNAMGWFGAQAEYYLASERLSGFVGMGYTLGGFAGDPTGVTFALGLRGFTPGQKHRGFLELSVSQIAIQSGFVASVNDRFYGPGVQAGYQFVSRGGFTFMVSLGAGYAPGVPDGQTKVYGLGGLGLGYTWRSRTAPAAETGAGIPQ